MPDPNPAGTARHGPRPEPPVTLADLADEIGFDVGAPTGTGWLRLDACDGPLIRRWVDDQEPRLGRRDVAGAYLARWFAHRLTAPVIGARTVGCARPSVEPDRVWVHRDADGVVDRAALVPATAVASTAPPVAPDRPDGPTLRQDGKAIAATLAPLLDHVRAAAPFGRRGLWAMVGDAAGGTVVRLARSDRFATIDLDGAWTLVDELITGVETIAGPLPRPGMRRTDGQEITMTRGQCCLYYRSTDAHERPEAERYCSTCPLRPDQPETPA